MISIVLLFLYIPMLNITRFARKLTAEFTLLDRTIVKFDLIILGLLLAKIFPVLTSLHWGWYIGVIVLVEIYFIKKIAGLRR